MKVFTCPDPTSYKPIFILLECQYEAIALTMSLRYILHHNRPENMTHEHWKVVEQLAKDLEKGCVR